MLVVLVCGRVREGTGGQKQRAAHFHVGRLSARLTKEPLRSSLLLFTSASVRVRLGVQFRFRCWVRFVVWKFVCDNRCRWLGFPPFFQSAAGWSGAERCRFSTEKPSSDRKLQRTCDRTRRSSSVKSLTRSSEPTSKWLQVHLAHLRAALETLKADKWSFYHVLTDSRSAGKLPDQIDKSQVYSEWNPKLLSAHELFKVTMSRWEAGGRQVASGGGGLDGPGQVEVHVIVLS